ncbi:MAG TPA: hypothetical protein DEH25_08390 [Chloroflexi bacterium]|nr:hypothetical protein [Chloroflexota bacterium]
MIKVIQFYLLLNLQVWRHGVYRSEAMKKSWVLVLLIFIITQVACRLFFPASGDETNPAVGVATGTEADPASIEPNQSSSTGPAELQYIFEIPADPIQVSVSLDSAHEAEAIIGPEGGSLSVSGTDGTSYKLDIPPDALATETLIRMIPTSMIEGMPFGSEQYAVQFQPEGLQFYDFAILTITPAQELPIDQQIFFGYQGEGENLVLAPPVVDSHEIKIQLDHFSGYGVSKGFLADIEPVRARIGGDAEARLRSAIAEQLLKARQEQLLGNEDAGSEIDWEGFFQQWEEQVVKPRLAAAGESCAAGRLAIQTVLGYERQRQLLGMADDSGGSTLLPNGLLDTVTEVCMKEEFELCQEDHIIHRILPAWLETERQYQLLGLASDSGSRPQALENAKNYVRRCLTFELQFHSEANFDGGEGEGYDSVVDSKIKIQFNPDEMKMRGQAPLVNTDFEFKVTDCKVTSNRGGDTFEAMDLSYISDTKSPTDALGYVSDFNLIYYPGDTKESFTVSCPDSGSYTSPATPLWTGVYLITHQGEMSMTDGGFIADDWEIFGDEYYAKKEWIKEDAGEGVFESGTFKLYHKPE